MPRRSDTPFEIFFQDTGKVSTGQPLCTIDTKHGLILLHILEGVIKLIYLEDLSSKESSSKNLEAYNNNIKYVKKFLTNFYQTNPNLESMNKI